ncbi:MAG: hypothetical protein COB24_12405 [Hyphomicrobiales bacterium]|nr:MAG: hypothetical protein COB24_12405 [Hyphomicrobiales bacterium]
MSNNLKLVQYFFNEIFENKIENPERLSNLVTCQFSYYLNLGERKNFQQFAARARFMNTVSDILYEKVTTEDDVFFITEFEVKLPKPNQHIKSVGFSQIEVSNGLIHQINIHYSKNDQELEEFQTFLGGGTTVFL